MPTPTADEIALTCHACGAETGLALDDSFESREVRCRACGAAIYWRHCAACETGSVVDAPTSPCPECGAAPGERERPAPPSAPPDAPGSLWRAAVTVPCPCCGRRFAPVLARLRRTYLCPHCGRLLEDGTSRFARSGRLALCVLLGLAVFSGADLAAAAALGPGGYARWRTAWLAIVVAPFVLAGVLYVGRPRRLRAVGALRTRE